MSKTKRTALITGSGRNIGRACALALAADGINLVVNGSSNQDACEQTAAMARELGVKAEVAMGDIGQEAEAHEIADEAILDFGAVDILVCNAAIRPSHDFLEMTDERYADRQQRGQRYIEKYSHPVTPENLTFFLPSVDC